VTLHRWLGLANWPVRRWAVAVGAALAYLLAVGMPTDLVPNPVFGREIPPTWWAWPALAISAALAGLLAGTYVDTTAEDADRDAQRGLTGGVLTFFAVGCPVCNKLVVLALGTSGAFTYFAPVQPLLGFLSVGLLAYALRARLAATRSCAVARPVVVDGTEEKA